MPQNQCLLDPKLLQGNVPEVPPSKPDRRYFETWLRRASRQLSASGKVRQIATLLAKEDNTSPDEWATRLRTILAGDETPNIEILTRIDALLAKPKPPTSPESDSQQFLF